LRELVKAALNYRVLNQSRWVIGKFVAINCMKKSVETLASENGFKANIDTGDRANLVP
jgi:hypothetical protein